MKTLLIVTLFVTGALAVGQGNILPSYSDFDTNDNGKITQKEFQNTQQKRMQLNAESGKMMRNAGNAPVFSDIDTNKDGNIDRQEFKTHQSLNYGNMSNKQNKGNKQGRNR